MKSLFIGIIILAAAVLSMMPIGLGWWPDVVQFLRGFLPVIAVIVGIVVVLVGIADMKDRINMKREGSETKPEK